MSTSKSGSESSLSASAKSGSSAMDGCESSDLDWKKTESPTAISTPAAVSPLASTSDESSSASSSDASSSAVCGAPLPGPAAQQVQQRSPNDISAYSSTFAVTNAGLTVAEFGRTNP